MRYANSKWCEKKMKMKKWSSQWTQFMKLRKEAWKKFRTSTEFDLAITGAMLYQLSYEATDVNDVCDIIVFGNLRFRPSTFKRIDSVFKNLHSEERFEMMRFRWTFSPNTCRR